MNGRLLLLGVCAALTGCFSLLPSSGGGQTTFTGPREVNPADVALPRGFVADVAASGLTFPTGVAFDSSGAPYVVEAGYSYGEVFATPRLLKIAANGTTSVIAAGGHAPWNGVTYVGGNFYVAQGGELDGGRIVRITPAGATTVLVDNLPSLGDHHTDGPAAGPDGFLYFGQGTATNSGIVGPDNADFGWLKRHPDFHDTPCQDIILTGTNYVSTDPIGSRGQVSTGAFLPFGTPSTPGQVIRGALPCNGAVMRVPLAGGPLELVAWGFRNPFGLAFSRDGRLFVAENQADDRGSRPVFGTGDLLWAVTPGAWYGWPDYHAGAPLSDAQRYGVPGKTPPGRLLAADPGRPQDPVARLGVHSSSNGLDFSRSAAFGFEGDAFVAQFGDLAPEAGKVEAPVGFKVVRVDVQNGTVTDFAANRGGTYGPASKVGGGGLERPTAARFDPSGANLYVVDFGVMLTTSTGPVPQPGTGVLWRIHREGSK